MPTVLIVDDHELMRRGVRNLLSSTRGVCVCGEAADGADAVQKVKALKPDLVILDLSMPVMNGIEAARYIRQASPATKIIVYTMHDSVEDFSNIEVAPDAFLVKSRAASELVSTVQRLLGPARVLCIS
jgi:DNA-binding NarL/FixJ family response regulator